MAPTLRSIVLLSAALSADAFVARPNSAMTRARTAPQMGLGGLFKTKSAEVASAPDLSKTPITEAEVEQLQANWANAIKTCSKIYLEGGDYVGAAAKAAGQLYGYGNTPVLLKPTKAAEFPFRPTAGEAMSYFVGGKAVDSGYDEDGGFAINGGKGFSKVIFTNHAIDLNGPVAIAMGEYVFTCATTGDESKVEYTFGYKRNEDGRARIFLHHSSVPYAG